MKKWGPFSLILLSGVLIGCTLSWWTFNQRRFENRGHRHERMMNMFSRKLALSEEQRRDFSRILGEGRKKMDALRDKARPEYEAIRKDTQNEIRKILTPAQMEKFDDIERKAEERRTRRNAPMP
jgi:Spy/CpxP family protein refolding chaperone